MKLKFEEVGPLWVGRLLILCICNDDNTIFSVAYKPPPQFLNNYIVTFLYIYIVKYNTHQCGNPYGKNKNRTTV